MMDGQKTESHHNQNDLDQEFSQILRLMKPYICHINNSQYLNQCCVWLKKLSCTHPSEKVRRNQYLIRLANQIQNGILNEPFTQSPPQGLLEPLTETKSLDGKSLFGQPKIQRNWDYENEPSQNVTQNPETTHEASKRNLKLRRKRIKRRNPNNISTVNLEPINLGRLWSHRNNETKSANNVNVNRNDLKLSLLSNHSSWCDLSDDDDNVSPSIDLAFGDREKTTITLFQPNGDLNSNHESLEARDVTTASKITVNSMSAANEVEALKYRLQDLVEVKNALQNTYYTTEDWIFTINSLKKELNCFKIENIKLEKIIEMNRFEIQKFHKHLENEKNYFEDIINKNNLKNEKILKEKFEEIRELHKKINDYEIRFNAEEENNKRKQQENTNEEQVHNLKKCISKMSKMFQKSEKEHLKQVDEMNQEIERLNLKLKTQKAELLTNLTVTKHKEFDAAFNELETKYKQILEKHQSQISLN